MHQTPAVAGVFSRAMSRRSALGLLLSGAGSALLAACGGAAQPAASPPPSSAPPSSAAAAPSSAAPVGSAATASKPPTFVAVSSAPAAASASAQPKTGGTLRVGQVGDIARLDGQLVTAVNATWMPYDRLTAYNDKLQPQPMLAESWDISDNFATIKLNLRKGVTYHTGRELTSDDVKWNIMHVRDPKVAAGALILQSSWFTSVETPDKYTAILKSDKPRPATFDFFEYFDIVDSETQSGPDAQTKSVGTGPFVFQEWVQGDHLTFTKNKNYWRTGRPYLDGVSIKIQRDATAAAAALESGAFDVADGTALADYARLSADPKYVGWQVPSGTNVIGQNVTMKPQDNKMVRQAMNYALDRKRIVQTVYKNIGDPEDLPWLPNSLAYDASKNNTYPFDMDKAKALLAQAGLAAGTQFDIVTTSSGVEAMALAQIMQSALAQLGITLTIKPYTRPATWTRSTITSTTACTSAASPMPPWSR